MIEEQMLNTSLNPHLHKADVMPSWRLVHGSLFSGIGGFELGAELAGIDTLWNCEIDKWNRELLKQNFPNTKQYDDIRTLQEPEQVSIISGGFPCQDISLAGKGTGIKGSRSGLWSEMFRVVGRVRPKYLIIENSSAITFRGLERVLCDLSEIGYDAEWQSLSGFSFGIQQGRERTYIIAYPKNINAHRVCEYQTIFREFNLQGKFRRISPGWRTRREIPEPRTFRTVDDIPYWVERTKGIGNAVMPIVAWYLFYCIKCHYEQYVRHGA
jgi:DNA (cytosine-5)-methyltransferase 1